MMPRRPDGEAGPRRPVVHYLDAGTFGGCEQVALTLLAHLDRRFFPVLFHHDTPAAAQLVAHARDAGIETQALPAMGRTNRLRALLHFVQALRQLKPLVFHAHLGWPLGCRHGIVAARLARVPCVVATSHLFVSLEGVRAKRLKQRLQAAALDRYIAVSNEVRSLLVGDLGVAEHKLRLVRNGVAPSVVPGNSRRQLRSALGIGDERALVLTPARLHPQKGHAHLLEAARSVPDAVFLLAGDGPERERLECRVGEFGLQQRVRFLGHRTDIAQLLSACDLFVLPSLYEGLPLTVLEAMQVGTPVIATSVGGTAEAVVDGICGRLVPPADSHALACAINELLADRPLAARLAASAQVRVRSVFGVDSMVDGVERVYDELLRPQVAGAGELAR